MKERKKPSQSWIEKSKFEIENADRLLAERIEKVKEIRKKKVCPVEANRVDNL